MATLRSLFRGIGEIGETGTQKTILYLLRHAAAINMQEKMARIATMAAMAEETH